VLKAGADNTPTGRADRMTVTHRAGAFGRTGFPTPIIPPGRDNFKYDDRSRDGDRIPVRPGTRHERVRLSQGSADCFDRILRSIGVAWRP